MKRKLPSLPLIALDTVLPLARSEIVTFMPATPVGSGFGIKDETVPGPESTRPKTTAEASEA